jgi:hypothetical protein
MIDYPDSRFAFSKFYFTKDSNEYKLHGDFATLAPKTPGVDKTYYVDFTNGNDSRDGLTLETALKSLNVALGKSDVDVVLITAGRADNTITRGNGWQNISPSRSVTIKSLDGQTILTAAQNITQTWETTSTSGIWKTTAGGLAASITGIIDKSIIDSNGDALQYTKVASPTEVTNTESSWCLSGSYIYIHCNNKRTPDEYLRLFMPNNNGYITGNITVYVEGIVFEGGSCPMLVSNTSGNPATAPTVIFNNCEFKYGSSGNGGLATMAANVVYLNNCVAARNYNDGFNYHSRDGVVTKILEANCIGRYNGVESGTDNGSTIHDGLTIIRFKGEYFGNRGANVMDVNTGSISWNIACNSHDALNQSERPDLHANYIAGMEDNLSVEMWLDGCISSGTPTDLVAFTNSIIYTRNLTSGGVNSGSGTIQAY